MTSGRNRTGDDPTRTEPGGSGTTSKITEESALGSDRGGDEGSENPRGREGAGRPALPR